MVTMMQRITSLVGPVRTFWADPHQRKTLMWVIAALAVVVIVYGVFTAVQGQRQYDELSGKIEDAINRRDAFTQQFPTAEIDGEIKPDLTNATQSDRMFITMMRRDEMDARRERTDADNQRRQGVRVIGIGVIGLGLAYLVSPSGKPQPAPDEDETSGASDSDETPPTT
jgi:hypothetical protein